MQNAIKPKRFIKFMPDLSLPAANLWNAIGNFALIAGAFFVLLGTWLTIWTGGQKERYADERISTNEKDTSVARAEAANAIKETETIKNENLKLSLQLEQERSARLKIESGLASRRLTGSKRKLLVNSLKSIQPTPHVDLQRIVGDAETRSFGAELIASFNEAGVMITDFTAAMALGFPEGITIIGPMLPQENGIAIAFKTAGFTPSVVQGPVREGFSVRVIVGLKPPSF